MGTSDHHSRLCWPALSTTSNQTTFFVVATRCLFRSCYASSQREEFKPAFTRVLHRQGTIIQQATYRLLRASGRSMNI